MLGPNGAGKSTLLRALAGLVDHDGALQLADLPVSCDRARARAPLSFVPQHTALTAALPVREVVALGRSAFAERRARAAHARPPTPPRSSAMHDTDVLRSPSAPSRT